jgi:hypothetical protein
MVRVVLTQPVKVLGSLRSEGDDVSELDSGTVVSLLNAGWAKKVEVKQDADLLTNLAPEPGALPFPKKKDKVRR